jgi:hypothetical protein
MLEPQPVAGDDAHAGMNTVTADGSADPTIGGMQVFHLHGVTDSREGLARARPGGNTM